MRATCSRAPELLLSDVMMRHLRGVNLAIRMMAELPESKILLLSGQAGTVDLLQKALRGGGGFLLLAKPLPSRGLAPTHSCSGPDWPWRVLIVDWPQLGHNLNGNSLFWMLEREVAFGRVIATLAHEINNPLESLTHLLYLLREEAQSADGRETAEEEGRSRGSQKRRNAPWMRLDHFS
jgi:CheY-like chemotaxis protein